MKQIKKGILVIIALFTINGLFAQINTGGTASVPFGKNTAYKFGIMPTNLPTGTYGGATAAADAYNAWKTAFVRTCTGSQYRVLFDDNYATVSEGIGYGMLVSVYAADKAVFDGLWAYYKANMNGNNIMNWKINGCSGVSGSNGATDAELDVAMALTLAAEQWTASSTTYTTDAKTMIQRIKTLEMGSDGTTLNGDAWGSTNTCRNPSYFAPGYYTQFAKIDANNASFWSTTAITASNTVLNANRNATSGLVSNWCDNAGTENSCGNTGSGAAGFGADACRNPWRMAIDYLWNGTAASSAAISINTKLAAFVNGYENQLKGPFTNRNISNPSSGSYINGSYATFALAPMTQSSSQSSLNKCYTAVANLSNNDGYFNTTMRLLSMFTLTGQFWAPGASGFVFPPTIATAVTSTNGLQIILTANKALTTSTPAASVFTVFYNGVQQATGVVSAAAVSGSTITLTVTTAPLPGQTIAVSYTGTTITSTETAKLATFTKLDVLNMLEGNETILDDCDDGNELNNVGGIWFSFNDMKDQNAACTKGTISTITRLSSPTSPFIMTAPGYTSAAAVAATFALGTNYKPYASGTSGACASWTNPAYVGIGTYVDDVETNTMDWRTGTGVSFWYKGPAVSFQVILTEVTDFAFHAKTIPVCTTWTKQTILWSQLAQPTWTTKPIVFSAQHVSKLQWQYGTDVTGLAATGTIGIDDVRIMNMPPVALTSMVIDINPKSKITNPLTLTLTSTDTLKLIVTPTPATASYLVAFWSSSDTTVVKVDYHGHIKVIGYGDAIITARAKMHQSIIATYAVKVPAPTVNPTAITFTPNTASVNVGETDILIPTFAPVGVTATGLTWLSSNTAIATVSSNGTVTGVSAGQATITATSTAVTSVKGTVTVTIVSPTVLPTAIVVSLTQTSITTGGTSTASATITPTNATDKTVTWSSSNTAVATVNATTGVVTGVSAGNAEITATSVAAPTIKGIAGITVTTSIILPTAVAVTLSSTSIGVGSTSTASAVVTPITATDKSVTWSSSNTAVATVNSVTGLITAVSVGTSIITATSVAATSITGTATLNVLAVNVLPTAVAVSLTSGIIPPATTPLVVAGDSWKYFKGTVEASNPITAWRAAGFDDAAWTTGVTPFSYGEPTVTTGTQITGMQNVFSTLYFRKKITIADIIEFDSLIFNYQVDDGFIVWINDVIVLQRNAITTTPYYNSFAVNPQGEFTNKYTASLARAACNLINGDNQIAIMVFNGNLTSSDIYLDMSITAKRPDITGAVIAIGETSDAIATVTPTNATDKSVIWSSSNPSVASVDPSSGIVTGVSVGTADITATSVSATSIKSSAQITVTISTSINETQNVSLSQLNAYPVPFTDMLTLTSDSKMKSVSLMSVTGALIAEYNVHGQKTIQLQTDQLAKGLVFIKVEFENNSIKTIKAVK